MKTTTEPIFSNGNEFMLWTARNCDRCVKQSHYIDDIKGWTDFKCAIERDILAQAAGLNEVSQRSHDTAQNKDCPFIKTTHSPRTKKRAIKNQLNLGI